MKKNFKAIINYYFIAALASLLLIGGCALKKKVRTAEVTVENPSVYTVHEEKIKNLEQVRNMVKKEQLVCIEHCAQDATCLERCQKAYKSRMDREYQKIQN
jgi:hypothetical protein